MILSQALAIYKSKVWIKEAAIALFASCFIALAAQISIPFPFTQVPFTLQPQAVLLVATLLGSKRGLLAVLCYLLEGAMGAPVFAESKAGAMWFFAASGGYLISYLPVSWIMGKLCESPWQKALPADTAPFSFVSLFLKLAFSSTLILLGGSLYLSSYIGLELAWKMGFMPFFVLDMLKAVMIACLLSQLKRHPLTSSLS